MRMELSESPAWRMANVLVLAFVIACAVVSIVPSRNVWFGLVSDQVVQLLLSIWAGYCIHELTKRYVKAIRDYNPHTQIQAKRANEQIRFSANFGNTISAAWISIMALSQLIKPGEPSYAMIAFAVAIAGFIHVGSRNMVALIKDENIST
jgi:hypothetical protein